MCVIKMASPCLNCGNDILWGNFTGEDFCQLVCEAEYRDKHPDYDKRGERDRCCQCGSAEITTKIPPENKILQVGNVLTPEPFKPHNVKIEDYTCRECGKEGQNLIIGDPVNESTRTD